VNISSLEVEQVLNSHPSVVESAVIGVPGDLGDEHDVKAVVMAYAEISAEDLLSFARSRLPRASVPRYVEVVDDMPRTPTGKILKRTLREDWRTSTTYDGETGDLMSATEVP
jgi:crotonobetaine/carnitine-CoA ligase